jgi:phenylalanyl-tRNA synthetase alpha subunit
MKMDLKSKVIALFGGILGFGILGISFLPSYFKCEPSNSSCISDFLAFLLFVATMIITLEILVVSLYSNKKTINELSEKLNPAKKEVEETKPNIEINEKLKELSDSIVGLDKKIIDVTNFVKIENLQKQLFDLKLSLVENKISRSGKKKYDSIISKIESMVLEIEAELNQS